MTFATDLAAQQAAIDAVNTQAGTFLQSLLDATNVQFNSGFNIDDNLPNNYNYATVPQVSFPIQGAGFAPDITTDTDPPPSPPATSFTTVLATSIPEFLSSDLLVPSTEFSYTETGYESILLDPLKAKLLADLSNGGYGIETDDETDLFNRARDREVDAMLTRVEEAGRLFATRGFPLPPGELSLHADRAYQEMQDKVSSASRDITLTRSKLYVDNRQFTIREVRELEQITIAFHNAVRERALNVARYTVELAIALYNVSLARFRARVETAKITSDVQVSELQAQIEQARINLETFRAQIVGYEANVRRQIESGRLQVEYYRGATDEARMLNDGSVAAATLQTKLVEATVQQNIQISHMTIENAKAKLQAAVAEVELYAKSIHFGAEKFYAQLTAMSSTINSLNVQTATA